MPFRGNQPGDQTVAPDAYGFRIPINQRLRARYAIIRQRAGGRLDRC